ncbi:hypothetical protein [Caballeronia grimmiae]|uniref:Uncharacterized protein n=1 Tax=Caballeronia grimmiae TaxID=1071679 RepID=A0A069P9Z1_9BURK|nr:hypothetical protein [Caballeronia grimmiae]KDR37480.1 hypothetical protein BG57_01840 [Caballeronia grimmiae]GGD68697.1 hypothetical protein GCM10010985_23930 [Caballeronia grimmiae]
MTEPLIDIEGKLRLPALRALAGPSLMFGREWSPWRSRPIRSESEFAIAAALFRTAYVDALGLRDGNAPYRAANIWGMLTEGRIRQKMLHLMQAADAPANPAVQQPAEPVRVPLAVSAPAAASAVHDRYAFLAKPMTGAIALACAALIVWLLFGRGHHPVNEEPEGTIAAVRAIDTPKPMAASQVTVPVSVAASSDSSTSHAEASAIPSPARVEAESAPQPAATPAQARTETHIRTTRQAKAANPEAQASVSSVTVHRAKPPKAASPDHASTKPRNGASTVHEARAPSSAVSTRAQMHAPTRGAAAKPEKRASHTTVARGARRSTVGEDYAVVANPAPKVSAARRAYSGQVAQESARPRPQPPVAMNVEALYSLLQHNPTLDSNAPAPRR